MNTEKEIHKAILTFLDQPIIYEPQILSFENKIISEIKEKKLQKFFRSEIILIKSRVKNGQYIHADTLKSEELKSSKIESVQRTEKVEEPKKSKNKKRNKVKTSTPSVINVANELIELAGLTVYELSTKLQVSDSIISSLLEQNGVNKQNEIPLSQDEFIKIRDFIESRLIALKRNTKSEENLLIPKKGLLYRRRIGVYEKMAKYGIKQILYNKMRK